MSVRGGKQMAQRSFLFDMHLHDLYDMVRLDTRVREREPSRGQEVPTSGLDASAARARNNALGSYSGKVRCSQFVSVNGVNVSLSVLYFAIRSQYYSARLASVSQGPSLRWTANDSQAENSFFESLLDSLLKRNSPWPNLGTWFLAWFREWKQNIAELQRRFLSRNRSPFSRNCESMNQRP